MRDWTIISVPVGKTHGRFPPQDRNATKGWEPLCATSALPEPDCNIPRPNIPGLLLIDDDELFRKMLCRSLELAGYTVTEACDGKEGLALYNAENHALVITDLIMPDMEGLEVIMKLRRRNPAVKIIAMSGGHRYAPATYLETAQALGASKTFTKPFPFEALIATIKELLSLPTAVSK